ncbi:MAG: GMC family oxidoreductase [Burkholderiales bacterium]|nr:GMC family oxidoreductase [Burkholderiales bacterium]MDP2396962.1 GMC family oxidoreductase [Burkholderiales bacterium]
MALIKQKNVDVVVVGCGVSGSILCMELAAAGLRVVNLERGRMIDGMREFSSPHAFDEFKYERHSDIFQNLSRETVTFRNSSSDAALPMREMGSFKLGEVVGGTALHWGTHSRRFLPWDFESLSKTIERYGPDALPQDCSMQDWGITYEELEPYYDQFEHLYGVGGKAGNLNGEIRPGGNPFEGARSREYPNPPAPMTYAGSIFAEATRKFGYTPHVNPVASMTESYVNPYRLMLGKCMRGGFCSSHGCANGAKANPLTAVMPVLSKHKNYELRPLCNVIRINLDSSGKCATGVNYIDARGREVEQPADLVILASYTFNNTRLLLLSGIGKPYDPIANTGVIGKNYSYQTGGKVTLFFEDKVFNPFMGGGARGVSIDDFNGDNFDHSGLGFVGGAYVAVSSSGAPPIKNTPVPPGTPGWGLEWKRAVSKYYNRNFSIRVTGGCQSHRGNYLDLDPTYKDANGLPLLRMTFDWTENERRMSSWISEKALDIAREIGASKLSASPTRGHYSIVPYQSTHNVGGVIMGADSMTSAVNKYLQSWDVSNLFVVGGSAFPQNSANPPTNTIGALACWVADAIKDQYLRRPGPLV